MLKSGELPVGRRFPRWTNHARRVVIILIALPEKRRRGAARLCSIRCHDVVGRACPDGVPCCSPFEHPGTCKQSCSPGDRRKRSGRAKRLVPSLSCAAQQPRAFHAQAARGIISRAGASARGPSRRGRVSKCPEMMNTVFDSWDRSQAVLRTRFHVGGLLFVRGLVDSNCRPPLAVPPDALQGRRR